MAQLLFDEGNFKDVLEVSSKFLETNQAHRLIYAKALIATNTPEKAVELLLSYEMLPSEGARESRVIYHNACVEASLKFYDEGNLENAINYAEKALLWPRNLGVGKPYDVDERMENYLLARMYGEKKDKAKEKEYNDQVLNHSFQNLSPNGNLLFQLDVLRKENKEKEAESLLGNLLADYPESPQLVWVEKLFHEEPMNATEVSGHLQLVKKVYYTLN